nr:hypothetical protein [Kibdelosporangium sp. MJ126-NF4]
MRGPAPNSKPTSSFWRHSLASATSMAVPSPYPRRDGWT